MPTFNVFMRIPVLSELSAIAFGVVITVIFGSIIMKLCGRETIGSCVTHDGAKGEPPRVRTSPLEPLEFASAVGMPVPLVFMRIPVSSPDSGIACGIGFGNKVGITDTMK